MDEKLSCPKRICSTRLTIKVYGNVWPLSVLDPLPTFFLLRCSFWAIFLQGERGLAPIIGDVKENSLASQAGLEAGMEILAIDGVKTPTLNSVSKELFHFIGTSGDIPVTVAYADSDLQYDLRIGINSWLRGEENSCLCES